MSVEFGNNRNQSLGQFSSAELSRLREPDGHLALAADALKTIIYSSSYTQPCSHNSASTVNQFEYSYLRVGRERPKQLEQVGVRIRHTRHLDPIYFTQEYDIAVARYVDAGDLDEAEQRWYYLGEIALGPRPYLGAVNPDVLEMAGERGLRYVNEADCDWLLDALSELETVISHEF